MINNRVTQKEIVPVNIDYSCKVYRNIFTYLGSFGELIYLPVTFLEFFNEKGSEENIFQISGFALHTSLYPFTISINGIQLTYVFYFTTIIYYIL